MHEMNKMKTMYRRFVLLLPLITLMISLVAAVILRGITTNWEIVIFISGYMFLITTLSGYIGMFLGYIIHRHKQR